MKYLRTLRAVLEARRADGKAIILVGPRQVGKTTLIRDILEHQRVLFLNGDDISVRNQLAEAGTAEIRHIIGSHRIIFVDEAQRIPNIGITLKIIIDHMPDVQVLVTGSSALELGSGLNEPLTGRKWEYRLFPISWEEFEDSVGVLDTRSQLESRLIYGMYPEVLTSPGQEKELLQQLVGSYLFKDILSHGHVSKPEVLDKLVQALALQIGSEVNYQELAQLIGADKNTVAKYINLLEQSFVIFRLGSLSRNVRNEIRKTRKVYFYDLGLRNTVIRNFAPLNARNDVGGMWENFLISERMKQHEYKRRFASMYFWRTRQQQEVDYVEEHDGQITGYEFKWRAKPGRSLPKTFVEAYDAAAVVIDRENFRDFVRL